ncbi:MAG: hypothetical protein IME97_01055 [Proteobacteria bacterium]|nr:hypothetical protein [Pseudomonadota bacterium]
MKHEAMILFWWLLFGGSHIIGSTIPVRAFVIGRIGNLGFKGLYSLVALATFIPLCWVYFSHKHAGNPFFEPNYFLEFVTHILMLAAFFVLVQGLATPSPMTTQAELTNTFRPSAKGIQRVTRHPQNFAFALFGLSHLLVNPYVGDWIFFGGFIVYAVGSAIHQDKRTLVTGPEQVKQFQSDTSAMPFYAILTGKQKLALHEYNTYGLLAAIIVFILLRLYHPVLFG